MTKPMHPVHKDMLHKLIAKALDGNLVDDGMGEGRAVKLETRYEYGQAFVTLTYLRDERNSSGRLLYHQGETFGTGISTRATFIEPGDEGQG